MKDLLNNIHQFFKFNEQYSSGRLIFILGSIVVFGVYIYDYKNNGVQNIVMSVLGYSSASITISKFSPSKPNENNANK
jgi:hypothetical protein